MIEKKAKSNCPICNGSMSPKEVLEAKDSDLDARLCLKHKAELYKLVTGRPFKEMFKQ